MSKRARASVFLLLIQAALIAVTGVAASAQTDPAKALVGMWEEWVEGIPNPERRW